MAKFCQSCGMPFSKDPQNGGLEADGTKSELYCSYCYNNGQFYQQDMNVKEFQAFCIEQMKKQGMPGFVAWLFTRGIPRLKRWRET